MLQTARLTAFTVSELLKENQQGGVKITRLPTRSSWNWDTPVLNMDSFE